ncbi:Spore protein SP21 [wastewater metagenome]|uniref:Spore protein SP21 n=2 Tax=unclassified sequences TaxID=12908 RepID=A0A5B8RLU2_9ZZZZ|nr:spore protein SP21 [uncultured organism]
MKPIRRIGRDDNPIDRFKNELDNVFQRFFDDPFFWRDNSSRSFSPSLNVEEKADRYVVEAEVPGMDPNEIELEMNGNALTIKGERKRQDSQSDDERNMHVEESSYGSFQRSFTLPDNIDADRIQAESRNGVLYIDVPKDQSRSRRIDIQSRD